MTKDKLLAVLDMSEDEQIEWVKANCDMKSRPLGRHFIMIQESMDDLAFRLRDEAAGKDWVGWQIGSAYVWEKIGESYNPGKFGNKAKPIHWIIASLIAKGETE